MMFVKRNMKRKHRALSRDLFLWEDGELPGLLEDVREKSPRVVEKYKRPQPL